MKLLKYFLAVSLLFSVFNCHNLFGQKGLKLSLSLEDISIGILDPLHYQFTLTNTRKKDIVMKEPWNARGSYRVLLAYKHVDSLQWLPIRGPRPDLGLSHGATRQTITISGFDSIRTSYSTLSTSYIPYPEELIYFFQEGNTYEFRAYGSSLTGKKKKKIYSNIVKVKIVPYNDVDSAAQKWLSENMELSPQRMYMLLTNNWGSMSMQEEKSILKKYETFIDLFPESKFTDWVKMYTAYLHMKAYNIDGKLIAPNFEKAEQILSEFNDIDDAYLSKTYDLVVNFLEIRKISYDKAIDKMN